MNPTTSNTRWRRLLPAVSSLALLLAGCGGGSGGGGGTTGTAGLAGSVISRNGSTANLAGLHITFLGTGQTVVTNANGQFDFGQVPAGTLGLRVTDPLVPATVARASVMAAHGADDPAGHDSTDDASDDQGGNGTSSDPAGDGDTNDTGDDDMDVTGVSDGETVEVHIAVTNGVIQSVEVSTSGHSNCEAEAHLTLASTSDDPDIEGQARLQNRTDNQRIKVKVENATAGRSLEAFVIAPDATEASLGKATVGADGHAFWDVQTANGDTLPFGAATVAELAGDGIEVRDGGNGLVLLFGTLSDTPPSTEDHGGTDHHCAGNLTPAAGVTGEARVEAMHRTDQNRDQFKVEMDHRTAAESFDVWLEDPANLGTFTNIGTIAIGSEGEGELEFDTHDGDSLPYGVAGVAALVGLKVEIRTGSTVLFSGTVPALVSD